MSDSRAVPCYAIHFRRNGEKLREPIVLDSFSLAMEIAKARAAMLRGIGSVLVSPLLDVRRLSAEKG